MRTRRSGYGLAVWLLAATAVLAASAAEAASTRHHARAKVGVRYAHRHVEGRQALVSDGPGTGFGFHHLAGGRGAPEPAYGPAAAQAEAVRQAVETDAITSGGFRSGFLGDDVAASVPYSNYGVFSGADGYGSPFFAGYYGPGDGPDTGDFGAAYDND
jgi:hypothetical protein